MYVPLLVASSNAMTFNVKRFFNGKFLNKIQSKFIDETNNNERFDHQIKQSKRMKFNQLFKLGEKWRIVPMHVAYMKDDL